MSQYEKTLSDYEDAVNRLEDFRAANENTIAWLKSLENTVATIEGELKAIAREEKRNLDGERFSVTYTAKARKWYDTDYILEHAPYVRAIPGVVVQTIDKAKIEALAKAQAIDADVCEVALRVEQMTPAISIKRRAQHA